MTNYSVAAKPWRQFPPNLDTSDWSAVWDWSMTVADPRTEGWLFMDSPWPTIALVAAYVVFVVLGCQIMKNREPFTNLKPFMIFYNGFVLLFNLWMFVGLVTEIHKAGYSLVCNAVDYSPKGTQIAWLVYCYYFSKLIDFTDTFIMIVRKKFDQVSFLHVYHHAAMFGIWWMAAKWAAGGDGLAGPLFNTFVHFVMYGYYLATTFGIRIPGKQYLTKLQMFQLCSVMTHSGVSLYFDCPYPHWTLYAQIAFLFSLLVLFMNFFIHEYYTKKEQRRQRRLAAQKAQ